MPGGFNPRDLMHLLGAVSTLRGNTGFAAGMIQAEQQAQARARAEEEQRQRKQAYADQQTDRADVRRDRTADNERQAREQRLRFIETLPKFLGDEEIDSPETFEQRLSVASRMGGEIGVEPGFLNTFRPTPDKFTQRKASKVVKRIESDKRFTAHLGNPEFAGQLFEDDKGERKTYAEWKALAGQGGPVIGSPPLPTKTAGAGSNTPEEEYLIAYATKRGKLPNQLTADERLAARKEWMQIDDRERPSATILIQTVDANGNPIQQFVKKDPGQVFAPAPTASQQTSLAEQESGLQAIANIERLFQPQFVGPIAGRQAKAQMAIPGAPDVPTAVAEFHAAVAGLENEIIKMMSGAAVSGAEERRMRNQLPRVTDKPSVFKAKLAQTKLNRERLLTQTKQKAGQPAGPPQTGGIFMHPQLGKVRVIGSNPDGTLKVEKVVP